MKDSYRTFTRLITKVLAGLESNILLSFMDDLSSTETDIEQHFRNFDTILQRIEDAGVVINLAKSQFLRKDIQSLGEIVREKEIA